MRRSPPTTTSSASMTWAHVRTEACDDGPVTMTHRSGRPPVPRTARAAAAWRAATRADRLPMVPPDTKQPPADGGRPARSDSQRRAWFSAHTAPPPSSHDPA